MNFNSRHSYYKTPFGAVRCGERVRVRFPLPDWTAAERVLFYIRKKKGSECFEMSCVGRSGGFVIYEHSFELEAPGIYYYRFEMHNRDGVWYYGRGECGEAVCGEFLPEWQLTVYESDYKTPDFAKGGLIYHIFADRFFKGKDIKTKRNYRLRENWNDDPEIQSPDGNYYADDFFGGNLKGISDKLDYISDLGVTVIYLSPIFEAFSNHRYDTGDYLKIDELLGTEADFKRLVERAAKKGVSVILDGVFNHSGADSLYFNKFGRYPSVGAYQSKDSPYYDWYYFKKFPDSYACWWGCDNVPDLNKGNAGYRSLLFGDGGVIEKWSSLGIAGWRLDVVDELPVDFTYLLCGAIRKHNENALIIGEVWEDASTKVSYGVQRPYLLGGQLDGVMNYLFKNAVIDFVMQGGARLFAERVMTVLENYPKESVDCLMNILGTHDTVRILNALSGVDVGGKSKKQRLEFRLDKKTREEAKKRLKAASVLQYTLPGIPSLYYGDEAGLEGFEDPINRRPFPWDNIDTGLLEHYRALGKIRRENAEIFKGGFEFLKTDASFVIFKRFSEKEEIIVAVNTGGEACAYALDKDYTDILNNKEYNKGEAYSLAPYGAAVLKG